MYGNNDNPTQEQLDQLKQEYELIERQLAKCFNEDGSLIEGMQHTVYGLEPQREAHMRRIKYFQNKCGLN